MITNKYTQILGVLFFVFFIFNDAFLHASEADNFEKQDN